MMKICCLACFYEMIRYKKKNLIEIFVMMKSVERINLGLVVLLMTFAQIGLGQSEKPKKDKVDYDNYDQATLLDNSTYKVKRNGQWAIIDFKENLLIDFDSSEVQFFKPGSIYYRQSGKFTSAFNVFNTNGELLTDGFMMGRNMKKILKSPPYKVYKEFGNKLKQGLISEKGEIIAPIIYDNCSVFSEERLIVRNDKRTYLLSMDLDTITHKAYESIGSLSDGLIWVVTPDYLWGYINIDGKEIIPPKYKVGSSFESDRAIVSLDRINYGVINKKEEIIVEFIYDEIEELHVAAALYQVRKNDQWGIVNLNGESIVKIEYDERFVTRWNGNLVGVLKEKKGAIDKSGEIRIPFDYDEISPMANLYARYFLTEKDEKFGIYDCDGNQLIETKYDSCKYLSKDLIEVELDGIKETIEIN